MKRCALVSLETAELDPERDGSYMAGRLLQSSDIRAWQWALNNIAHDDIETALNRRGVDGRTRALAQNWWGHAHLRHRVSRDLDFFTEHAFDVEALARGLVGWVWRCAKRAGDEVACERLARAGSLVLPQRRDGEAPYSLAEPLPFRG